MNRRAAWRRHVAVVLVHCVFWQPVVVFAGGIHLAGGGDNTRLDAAGNGVPVVDIATPDAKGLSHNTFRDYNVDARGLILNNATDKLQSTQLGGLIVGNSNLRDRAAKLIVNEVNGGNPSRLAGYTEVAGQRANVVIANPYGITCDGCGFINSPRVTLSTGRPVIDDGELDHFAVEQGRVAIEGLGLDATQVDRFDILTRAATLNAKIHAQRLNVVTGANDVDADSLVASPRPGRGKAPALAIDSSALGGMYAERISLVGTETGVGVKLAGDMAASAGDLRIDVDGHLRLADAASRQRIAIDAASATLTGRVHADAGVSVRGRDTLILGDTLTSGGDIALAAGQDIVNHGTLSAGVDDSDGQRRAGRLTLAAAALDNRGRIDATTRLDAGLNSLDNGGEMLADELAVTTRGALNNAGTLQGRDVTLASGATLTNTATVQGERLAIDATRLVNQGEAAQLAASDTLTLRAEDLANRAGTLQAGDLTLDAATLVNDAGRIQADQRLVLRVGDELDNSAGTLVADSLRLDAGGLVNDTGLIGADRALVLDVGDELSNRDGQLQVTQGDLSLEAGSLDNTGGVVLADALALNLDEALINRDGQLLGDRLELTAGSLDNGDAGLIDAGSDGFTATIAGTLGNAGGQIQAEGDVTLAAERLDNQAGTILGDAVTVQADDLDNGAGTLQAGELALDVATLSNGAGRIRADRTLALAVGDELDNAAGTLAADTLTLDAGSLVNDAGLLSADSAMILAVGDELSNRGGQLQVAQGDLRLDAARLDNTSGVALANAVTLDLDDALVNRGGQLLGERLDLTAGSLDNGDAGLIAAGSDGLAATVAGTLGNAGGRIQADGDVALNARLLDNRDGAILGDGLTVQAARLDNRQGALLGEAGGLDLTLTSTDALALDNRDGLVDVQGGALELSAGDGTLNNRGGALNAERVSVMAGELDNGDAGQVLAGSGGLTLDVASLANRGGLLSADGGALSAAFTTLDNRGGTLQGNAVSATGATLVNSDDGLIAALEGDATLWLDQGLDNRRGRILAQGALNIDPPAIDNRGGQLAGQQVALEAGTLTNDGGLIEATNALTVDADTFSNVDGDLRTLGGDAAALHVAGTLDNTSGRIALGSDAATLDATTWRNVEGSLTHAGIGRLTLDVDTWQGDQGQVRGTGDGRVTARRFSGVGDWQFNQGLELSLEQALALAGDEHLTSAGALTLDLAGLDNRGTIAANQGLTLDSTGDITNRGRIASQGALTVTGHDLTQRDGRLASGGDARYRLSGDLDNRGRLTAVGGLDLKAGAITNRGTLGSQGDLRLVSGGTIDNLDDSLLFAGDDMALRGTRLYNRYADIYARGDLDFARNDKGTKAKQLENRSATIEAEGDITLRAKDVVNTKHRYADYLELIDRSLDYQLYQYFAYRRHEDHDGKGGGGITVTWERVENGDRYLYDYDLAESSRTVITADSPQAHLVAGGDLRLVADDVLNANSVLAANGDIDIRTGTLQNRGAGREIVKQVEEYRSDTGEIEDSWNYRYYLHESDPGSDPDTLLAQEVSDWNAQGGVGAQGQLLALPETLAASDAQRVSTVTTHTALAGSEKAVISAGGRVTIHASQQFDNGALQEHQRSQLDGQLGNTATGGLPQTLTVTLDRQSEAAAPVSGRDTPLSDRQATGATAALAATGERVTSRDGSGSYRRVAPTQQTAFRLPQGRYGLFVRNTAPDSHYLIETNPEFTSVESIRGSDYLLDKLGYSDDSAYQLLGDGRYESRLVRDAVLANTGQRYLDGERDDATQYRDLMDNAAAAQEALGLEVGEGLSADQRAALDHDIVWLENQVVDGQQVLVPVLYLAQVDADDVQGDSLIRGHDIDLAAGGDLINVGTLQADADLDIDSGGSILQGGLADAGERLALSADDSIRNALAGTIRGGQVSLSAARGDIVNDRLAATVGDARTQASYLDAGATIEARDTLALDAGRDIVNRSQITSGGDATLSAGRDLVNEAVADVQRATRHARAGTASDSRQVLGASIEIGGDATVSTGRDVALTASTLTSDGELSVDAGRDLRLDVDAAYSKNWHEASGYHVSDAFSDATTTQQGSTLAAGGDATLNAGRDIALTASDVTSDGDLDAQAGRDIRLDAAVDRTSDSVTARRKTTTTESRTQQGSTLSAAGDLALSAGGDTTLTASRVEAGGGLAVATGGDLTLLAAANQSSYTKDGHHRHYTARHVRQQGSTLDAGGDLALSAGDDLTLVASQAQAGGSASLFAGNDVSLLTATDQDYSLYEKKSSGGLFGSSHYRRDEVDDRRAVASQIGAGEGLGVVSGGDQTYQGARLESGGDLTLTSLGGIDFATASDVHTESHEKRDGNFAWQSAKGEGSTDETLRQSQLIAQGKLAIQVAERIGVEVPRVDKQSVHQTIQAMAEADPNLAWLETLEARGDIDWRQVKAIHDSWDYSQSGLSQVAALALSIAVAAITSGAASSAIGAMSGTATSVGATSAASMWVAATETAAAGWANATLSGAIAGAVGSAAGAASQGQDWQDPALHGAITGGLANYLAAGTYYDTPLSKMTDLGQQVSQGTLLDAGKVVGDVVMQKTWSRIAEKMAKGVGLSEDELNWLLMAGSIVGDQLPGVGNRYKSDDQKFTLTESVGERGVMARGLPGLPFDVVDIALGYQGLPDASVRAYLAEQGFGSTLTGHSLGTLSSNYLVSNGLADHAELFSLPFGNIAAPNAHLTIGSGDLINGGYLGKFFNPDAIVAPLTPSQHPFENYKAFIDAHPGLYLENH